MADQKSIGAQLDETLAQLATKDEVRTIVREEIEASVPGMIRSELRAVTPEIVREINAHTDKVHGELREDLGEQGVRVRPMGARGG